MEFHRFGENRLKKKPVKTVSKICFCPAKWDVVDRLGMPLLSITASPFIGMYSKRPKVKTLNLYSRSLACLFLVPLRNRCQAAFTPVTPFSPNLPGLRTNCYNGNRKKLYPFWPGQRTRDGMGPLSISVLDSRKRGFFLLRTITKEKLRKGKVSLGILKAFHGTQVEALTTY